MRRKAHTAPDGTGTAGLVHEVEGYLLARAHHEQARTEAEDFCAEMPWLTTAQADEVTQRYIRRRLDVTRRTLRDTVERAAQLRQEYETRYATLRRDLLRRHAACASAVLAGAGAVSTFVCLLSR
jgi:hypothetical protein